MDHSYGVMQDSGMASPGQPMFRNVALKAKYPEVGVKSEPGVENGEAVYHIIIPEDFGHIEEVETTSEDSVCLTSSNSALHFSVLAGKKDSRSSSIEDGHHDSGISNMSSFVSDASSISTSHHAASQRTYLASPMEVFVPNATSTPEDGGPVCKMEVESPNLINNSNISDLHRSVMVSGIKKSPSERQMSVSPDDAAFIDVRPGTPVHNTSSDISHMEAPADGYFSRENLRSVQNKVSCNLNQSRLLNRRRAIARNLESTPTRQADLYSDQWHRDRTPSPGPKSIPKLNLNDAVERETPLTNSETRFPVNILKTEPQPVGTASGEKMVIQIPALKPRTHTLTYSLRPSLERTAANPKPILPQVKANFRHNGPSSAFSSLAQMNAAQQKPNTITNGVDSAINTAKGAEPRDDALTNIHWLHNFSSAGFVPNASPLIPIVSEAATACSSPTSMTVSPNTPMVINGNHIIIHSQEHHTTDVSSVVDSEKHIKKIAEECGRNQRPPYAYMHLIQMAIKSYPEQKATLKQIYNWIEETFPYYKYTNKKGWKNSIRHNLSLYNIFVRKRGSGSPGSTGCSYWTLQSGVKPMPKSRLTTSVFPIPKKSQGLPHYSTHSYYTTPSNSGKKGPAPLLPKPPAVQSYTIIPLSSDQSLSPSVIGSHTIVVTPDQVSLATSNGCLDTETLQAINSIISFPSSLEDTASAKLNSLKRSQSDYDQAPQKKLIKVAPKPSILNRGRRTSLANRSSSFDTSDLLHQMSNMKFDNTLTDASGQDSQDGMEQASQTRQQVRAKKPRKEKIKYRVDSTDRKDDNDTTDFEELDGACISIMNADQMNSALRIEEDMTSPLRGLLMTPPRDIKTSTPSKGSPSTPGSWISPIHGLSSVNDDHVLIDMAALLDETANDKLMSSEHQQVSPGSAGSSPGLGSLRSLGLPGLTPLKIGQLLCNPEDDLCLVTDDHISPNNSFNLCNQSFTKLLGDFHLDSVIGDDLTNGDYNLSFGPLH